MTQIIYYIGLNHFATNFISKFNLMHVKHDLNALHSILRYVQNLT